MNDPLIWGFGLSPQAEPVLQRLLDAGLIERIALPPDGQAWRANELPFFLEQTWPHSQALVAVGACGAITRLVAPWLQTKKSDPAVVVLDPSGHFAIPLLGGHGAGGDALAQRIAAHLGGQAVLTGASAAAGHLPLDCFGERWGWRRGTGNWDALMKQAQRHQPLALQQEQGNTRWRQLQGLQGLAAPSAAPGSAPGDAALVVSIYRGAGCRWHPPALWLGIGCERDTSLSLLERLLDDTLEHHGLAPEAVAGLASADRKADETALLELAERRGLPLRCFSSPELAAVVVPNPSATVLAELGTASVAEAAALLAAGPHGRLLQPKRIERAQGNEQGPPPWPSPRPSSNGLHNGGSCT